jgi:hypothetical protein
LRGHASFSWKLLPTISRPLEYAGLQTSGFDRDRELYLLNRFRRYSRAYLERDVDEKELMFLARHHGLPVRILDWTANPLVALYFACANDQNMKNDGAIWAILRCQHPHKYFYDFYKSTQPLLKLRGVKIIYAPYVSPRIVAQSCNFTIQDTPDKELQTYNPSAYAQKDFDIKRLEKWSIPSDMKVEFLRILERCGINERALFPDLDGIGRSIIRTEVLRSHSEIPKNGGGR